MDLDRLVADCARAIHATWPEEAEARTIDFERAIREGRLHPQLKQLEKALRRAFPDRAKALIDDLERRSVLSAIRQVQAAWQAVDPWHRRGRSQGTEAATQELVDLIFAYGLMRAGESREARAIVSAARRLRQAGKRPREGAMELIWEGYRYRIEQAEEGPSRGPLPPTLRKRMATLDPGERDHTDSARGTSYILEAAEVPFGRRGPGRERPPGDPHAGEASTGIIMSMISAHGRVWERVPSILGYLDRLPAAAQAPFLDDLFSFDAVRLVEAMVMGLLGEKHPRRVASRW